MMVEATCLSQIDRRIVTFQPQAYLNLTHSFTTPIITVCTLLGRRISPTSILVWMQLTHFRVRRQWWVPLVFRERRDLPRLLRKSLTLWDCLT